MQFEPCIIHVDTITEINRNNVEVMFYKVHFILFFEKHLSECNENGWFTCFFFFLFLSLYVCPSTRALSLLPIWMFYFSLTLDTSLSSVTRGFHLGRVLPL